MKNEIELKYQFKTMLKLLCENFQIRLVSKSELDSEKTNPEKEKDQVQISLLKKIFEIATSSRYELEDVAFAFNHMMKMTPKQWSLENGFNKLPAVGQWEEYFKLRKRRDQELIRQKKITLLAKQAELAIRSDIYQRALEMFRGDDDCKQKALDWTDATLKEKEKNKIRLNRFQSRDLCLSLEIPQNPTEQAFIPSN